MNEDFAKLLDKLTHHSVSGGIHVSPETRFLMFSLVVGLRANDVLELGYDAGSTLEALALTGAERVVGVDNLTEYAYVESEAVKRLAPYPNVKMLQREAVEYLNSLPDESVDFVHVDDSHEVDHVFLEAVQLRRVLRPGGIALFHNDGTQGLWDVLQRAYKDWGWVRLPAVSPYNGLVPDLGLVRKPMEEWN